VYLRLFKKLVRLLCGQLKIRISFSLKKHRKPTKIHDLGGFSWYARHDSNVRPTESESVTLSSFVVFVVRIARPTIPQSSTFYHSFCIKHTRFLHFYYNILILCIQPIFCYIMQRIARFSMLVRFMCDSFYRKQTTAQSPFR